MSTYYKHILYALIFNENSLDQLNSIVMGQSKENQYANQAVYRITNEYRKLQHGA